MSALIHKFIRSVPLTNLQEYFTEHAPHVAANTDWKQTENGVRKSLIKSVENTSEKELAVILDNIERLDEMTDELGQAALLVAAKNKTHFQQLPDPYTRANWMLRNEPDAFRQAEEVRYADANRDNRRIYSGYNIKSGLMPDTTEKAIQNFEQALTPLICKDMKIKIDSFQRQRRDAKGKPVTISQYAIYYETLPQTTPIFKEDNIEPLAYKPVEEASLVFDSENGLIEVLFTDRDIRQEIARAFVMHILHSDQEAEAIVLHEYNLERLLRLIDFPTDPEDRIKAVKVSSIKLKDFDRNNRLLLDLASDETRTVYKYLLDKFDRHDPTRSGFLISYAKITMEMEPPQNRKRGKTIHIKLTYPNGCNLSGRPDKERDLIRKYLGRWELVREI